MSQQKGHPSGLYLLFFTEMAERFSYYGMRAIFILFMTKALLLEKSQASDIYGSYTGLVYLTPLIGGYISDRYWGNRRSILVGGILMAIGQFLMFGSGPLFAEIGPAKIMMWIGLTFLIVGNGFFKPNISTMVGQLYPKGDSRIDGAFTIFYMGINAGAFFSPLICGGLGDTGNPADFKWGFLAAGIGMLLSTLSFELFKNKHLVSPDGKPVGMAPSHASNTREAADMPSFHSTSVMIWGAILVALFGLFYFVLDTGLIGSVIFSASIAIPGLIVTDKSLSKIEKDRIWVIFILAFFVIFFWSAFEQAGASLTFFADEQTKREIFGWSMPASYFQSFNPIMIIALAPLFTILWGYLSKKGIEPSSPLKMAIGLALLSIGYLIIAFGVNGVASGVKVSMFWLTTMYLLHTMGELSLSPIGLSMVSKLSPIRFASLLMGVWFLANATANKFAGVLSALYPPTDPEILKAKEVGIDLAAILNGNITPSAEQLEALKKIGISAEYPSIAGYHITNLNDFFMLFVFMSGAAALLLFAIHKRLNYMMHPTEKH